ncbi:hypothetical protein EPO05_01275 [Patescibacteria group bacterium]|nr:MAG: hypothetical protein EPO05_01275 [Patescibacteria group bacterium]
MTILAVSFLIIFWLILGVAKASAVCPVCTIAIGAGVGLSRWLGIDDTIAGLWIGALTVSMIMWTLSWFEKKSWNFPWRTSLTVVGYYLLIVVPLFYTGIMGHELNKIWGIDKLLLGIIAGSAAFYGSAKWYEQLKTKNAGHAQFPFQKVVMPVGAIAILSLLFYILTK